MNKKESNCGCAGIFSAFSAIEIYAEIFDKAGQIERLENFASRYGAEFYGLNINKETIILEKKTWSIPENLEFSHGQKIIPYLSGEKLNWQLKTTQS